MTPQDLLVAFQSKSMDKADYFIVSAGKVLLAQLDQSSVASLRKSGVITIEADGVDMVAYNYLKVKGVVSAQDMQKASPSFKKGCS